MCSTSCAVLSMDDTFFSWFRVMQLQVWLLCVRLGSEGENGLAVRQALLQAFWDDVEARTKAIGVRFGVNYRYLLENLGNKTRSLNAA